MAAIRDERSAAIREMNHVKATLEALAEFKSVRRQAVVVASTLFTPPLPSAKAIRRPAEDECDIGFELEDMVEQTVPVPSRSSADLLRLQFGIGEDVQETLPAGELNAHETLSEERPVPRHQHFPGAAIHGVDGTSQ